MKENRNYIYIEFESNGIVLVLQGLVFTLHSGSTLDGTPFDPVANLTASFGGKDRVNRIRSFIKRLKSKNANVKIVSTSWAPISAEQWQQYLMNITGTMDLGFEEDKILSLEDPGPGKSADKGNMIKRDMRNDDIEFDAGLFADDSRGNIRSAMRVCNTLLLPQRLGLDGTDCAYIEALVSIKKLLGYY